MRRDKEKEREKNSLHTPANSSLASSLSSRNAAVDLQRKAGNQAVLELLHSGAAQAKLRVSQPGDADEQEADRVVGEIVSSPSAGTLHRKCSCTGSGSSCHKCEEEESRIHRKAQAASSAVPSVSDDFLGSLGPGEELDPSTRKLMETRFKHDFGSVRIHRGSDAANSAQAVNARAFTLGNHVVFANQEYVPNTPRGELLLAHELTHVVQQGAAPSRVGSKGSPISSTAPRSVQRLGIEDLVTAAPAAGAELAARWLSNPRNKQFANDLLASVKEAPQHAAEILLGEVWEAIKAHWVKFLAVTIGMIAAETVIGILTGAPEPTLITKVIAVILQILVIAIAGYFAAVELVGVYEEGQKWFTQAREANGDPAKVTEASRSFLRMIRHIILAILAIAGVRAKIRGFSVPEGVAAGAEGGSAGLRGAGGDAPAKPPELRVIKGGGEGSPGRTVASGSQGAFEGSAARQLAPDPAQAPVLKEVPPLPVEAAKTAPSTSPSPGSVPGRLAAPASGVSAATSSKQKNDCDPAPVCPHKGGDPHHNHCADIVPPNVFPGCDVLVKGKNFDAISPSNTLWEVKTEAYSTYSDFLKRITLSRTIPEATREQAIASSCGYAFVLGLTDAQYVADVRARAPGLPVTQINC